VPALLLVQFEVKADKLEEATAQVQYTVGRQFELEINEKFSVSMKTGIQCNSRVFAIANVPCIIPIHKL
jgi:hypothetical protein